MNSFIVIPARLDSTRLPHKMLLNHTGKPLIQHTYESARKASQASGVCVATDSKAIEATVVEFSGTAYMTSRDATCGTDRLAELIDRLPHDILINVQGDEPEISPDAIDRVIEMLSDNSQLDVATLATPIRERNTLVTCANVKVLLSNDSPEAVYFSRAPIPFARDWDETLLARDPPAYLLHLGIYAYRRHVLEWWKTSTPSSAEQIEQLEQLRLIQNGYRIGVAIVDHATPGIDTIADYEAFVTRELARH